MAGEIAIRFRIAVQPAPNAQIRPEPDQENESAFTNRTEPLVADLADGAAALGPWRLQIYLPNTLPAAEAGGSEK